MLAAGPLGQCAMTAQALRRLGSASRRCAGRLSRSSCRARGLAACARRRVVRWATPLHAARPLPLAVGGPRSEVTVDSRRWAARAGCYDNTGVAPPWQCVAAMRRWAARAVCYDSTSVAPPWQCVAEMRRSPVEVKLPRSWPCCLRSTSVSALGYAPACRSTAAVGGGSPSFGGGRRGDNRVVNRRPLMRSAQALGHVAEKRRGAVRAATQGSLSLCFSDGTFRVAARRGPEV